MKFGDDYGSTGQEYLIKRGHLISAEERAWFEQRIQDPEPHKFQPVKPRNNPEEETLARAWWRHYDPKLGHARIADVAADPDFALEESGFRKRVFSRLHPGMPWPAYRPDSKYAS